MRNIYLPNGIGTAFTPYNTGSDKSTTLNNAHIKYDRLGFMRELVPMILKFY